MISNRSTANTGVPMKRIAKLFKTKMAKLLTDRAGLDVKAGERRTLETATRLRPQYELQCKRDVLYDPGRGR